MSKQSCGYDGHFCNSGVQFISRYRDENDYCVAGKRVRVFDDGSHRATCDEVTPEDRKAIALFLLSQYANYCSWNAEHRATDTNWPHLSPLRDVEFISSALEVL